MPQRVRLPEGLAQMPPGPELAAVLAGIDPSRLNGHDLVELAPAYLKLISYLQAGLATVLNQVQHSPPGDADTPVERTEHPNRWAEIELAAKLHWTAAKAGYELRYAHHLTRRLPGVHAALAAGRIDFPRARVIVDGVMCLDEPAGQQVAARLLEAGAAGWNTRQLAEKVRPAVIAHDPDAASRRQRLRQAERRVHTEAHPEGTADLYGVNLPPERVAAIVERIGAIARAAKRQGDGRTIDQLQADTLCDLLAGTGIGATPPGSVSNPGPTGRPDPTGDTDPDRAAAQDAGPAPSAVPVPGLRRGVVELTVPLSSLAGWSQAPGELAGWGPVIADVARQVATQQRDAQWRFSVYDEGTGELLHHGITHARPAGAGQQAWFAAADLAFVHARDRTCRGPNGCRVPASRCDTDHTVARAEGGGHERGNAGPLCRREHRFKHESGASLRQPTPGVFEWTSPLGHTYTVRPEPYDESTGPPDPP